jgi:hypothetical protein
MPETCHILGKYILRLFPFVPKNVPKACHLTVNLGLYTIFAAVRDKREPSDCVKKRFAAQDLIRGS